MSYTAGITSSFAPTYKPSTGIKVGGMVIYPCDAPETGGIGGNIRPDKPLPPYVLEERPIIVDPKTGERVYYDVWLRDHLENTGAKFLNKLA